MKKHHAKFKRSWSNRSWDKNLLCLVKKILDTVPIALLSRSDVLKNILNVLYQSFFILFMYQTLRNNLREPTCEAVFAHFHLPLNMYQYLKRVIRTTLSCKNILNVFNNVKFTAILPATRKLCYTLWWRKFMSDKTLRLSVHLFFVSTEHTWQLARFMAKRYPQIKSPFSPTTQ